MFVSNITYITRALFAKEAGTTLYIKRVEQRYIVTHIIE